MSRSPQFQVDGEWFPLFEPEELGTPEDESSSEEAQRIAHLREAKRREAERFRCPDCGELGAMLPPGDRWHPDRCPARNGGAA